MKIEAILAVIMIVLIIFFVVGFLFMILDDYISNKKKSKFEEDLKLAVKNNKISWDEVKEIALTRNLNQKEIVPILKRLMREILTKREEDLQDSKDLIKSYITKYEEDEPFEGIPNDIRLHLERLREKIDVRDGLLEPLTTQIVELLKVNNSQNKKQRFHTFAGFIFGLLGFIYAIYISNQEIIINNKTITNTTVKATSNKTQEKNK